jgi:hypothetical protein
MLRYYLEVGKDHHPICLSQFVLYNHPMLTNSKELSPSWEENSRLGTQLFSNILRNPKVHRRVHKSPQLVRILNQINPVHTNPLYVSKIHFNIVPHLRVCLPSGLSLSGFPIIILYAFFFSPIRATRPDHLTVLDLTILIILGEEYKLWSSFLCSFLQPPITSSIFGLNVFLSTLFSNTNRC